MGEVLLTLLSNEIKGMTGTYIDDKYRVKLPITLDGSLDVNQWIPVLFSGLNNILKHEHYNVENDNRSKSNAESTKLREEGNKLFALRNVDVDNLRKALEMYTKSIAHAIPGSQEIAFAYGNRAAVLLSYDRPEECLEDLGRAVKFGYPEESRSKLLFREAECFSKLATRSFVEAKNWLDRVPLDDPSRQDLEKELQDYPSTLDDANVIDEECLIPEIESPSEKFPYASDAVEVECSSVDYGPTRRVVASRDIEIGEVLIVEKHYFKGILVEKLYTHCSYCMGFAWAGIPCDTCKNVIYCSETCKAAAWIEYHEVECPVFGLLIQYPLPRLTSHCIRLLIQMCHEAGGLQKLTKRVEKFNTFTNSNPSLVLDGWYRHSTLESILCLTTNERILLSHSSCRINEYVHMSAILAVCSMFLVASRTEFFGLQYSSHEMFYGFTREKEAIFFAKLLTKLSLIDTRNTFSLVEQDAGESILKGFALAPLVPLVNHSCVSNAQLQLKRDHLVIHSVFPIKKGEKIAFSACGYWFYHSREERQKKLRDRSVTLACSCRACRENWPTGNAVTSTEFSIRAKTQCPLQLAEIEDIFQPLDSITNKICDGDLNNRDEMLKSLYAMLRYIHDNDFVPCTEFAFVLTLLDRFFRDTGNCAKIQKKRLEG